MDQHCDYADCAKPVVADIEALIVEGTRRCSAWVAQDDVIIDLIRFTLNCDSILGEDFEILSIMEVYATALELAPPPRHTRYGR
jgi:hypothetical protein